MFYVTSAFCVIPATLSTVSPQQRPRRIVTPKTFTGWSVSADRCHPNQFPSYDHRIPPAKARVAMSECAKVLIS